MLKVVAFSLALTALACASPASAQTEEAAAAPEHDVTQARTLFAEGVGRADQQRWGEAVEYFRRALAIVERPSIVFNLGVALFRMGRTAEAHETLDHYLAIADAMDDASGITQARVFLSEIEGSISVLTLHVTPADALVEVDGAAVHEAGGDHALRLDPGPHHLRVTAPRHDELAFDVSVLPGAHAERAIDLHWQGVEPGYLEIQAPPDVAVLLDDDHVGRGPTSLEVTPGEHVVRVDSTPPRRTVIALESGEHRTLTLDEIPLMETPPAATAITDEAWFWPVIAIASVLVIGGAIAIGVWASQPAPDPFRNYGGTTGVVLQPLSW